MIITTRLEGYPGGKVASTFIQGLLEMIWTYCRSRDQEKEASLYSCAYCTSPTSVFFRDSKEYEHLGQQYHDNTTVWVCDVCGWWTADRTYYTETLYPVWGNLPKVFHSTYGLSSCLKNLDLSDQSLPVDEVRSFLLAKYSSRMSVNPRLMEETIASVFADLGFTVRVTGYSNDGGVDVILHNGDEEIGVQVKRTKNTVKVEQIRSLAGALVLHGATKGVFVTTSDFTLGGVRTVESYRRRGLEIELMNAAAFFDALKLTRRSLYASREEFLALHRLEGMYPTSMPFEGV